MDGYTGTYQSEGREPLQVSIALLKNKIKISWEEDHHPKILFWPIDKLKIENNIIYYPGWPLQQLVPHQKAFVDQLEKKVSKDQRSFLHKYMGRQTARLLKFVSFILIFLSLLFFIVVPVIAGYLAQKVSPAYEIQVGNEIYDQLTAGMTVNEPATETVMRFFHQLDPRQRQRVVHRRVPRGRGPDSQCRAGGFGRAAGVIVDSIHGRPRSAEGPVVRRWICPHRQEGAAHGQPDLVLRLAHHL